MQQLTITLEWFLNPDHLPMIAGIESGAFAKHGLHVTLIEPEEHYDGFDALNNGEIDLHINEPIHLFEHYTPNICSLGCFFETRGGILMRESSLEKLKSGEKIRICAPVIEPETNRLGFEFLSGYAQHHLGIELSPIQLEFVSAGFYHIDNLLQHEDLDAAWVCFYNFEGVEAIHKGLDFIFIDQDLSQRPSFFALEFITTRQNVALKKSAFKTFLNVCNDMILHCQQSPELAKHYYYQYSKAEETPLMNEIIQDTLTRFTHPIQGSAERWSNLRRMLAQLDIVHVDEDYYQQLWVQLDD